MAFQHEDDLIQIGETYYRFLKDDTSWKMFKWGADGIVYSVTHHSCDCPAFTFRKANVASCKHMDALWELFPPMDKEMTMPEGYDNWKLAEGPEDNPADDMEEEEADRDPPDDE